jgi:L-iditol 2-dehydrogenase
MRADDTQRSDETSDHGGFDVVVETAGVPAAQNRAVLLGGPHTRRAHRDPVTDVPLASATFNHFLREEIALTGSWNSFSAPWPGREWTTTLEMMPTGRLRTAEMVSHRESLDRLPELVTWMGRHEGLFSKVMFFPNGRDTA